jgi:hypothetical protein
MADDVGERYGLTPGAIHQPRLTEEDKGDPFPIR